MASSERSDIDVPRGETQKGRPCALSPVDSSRTRRQFRQDVLRGLSAPTKSLPCKWLYNKRGSELFEKICETPEYYVTRTEMGLLAEVCPQVAQTIGQHADVIEPGSGAGEKVRWLLDALDSPRSFVPIEISPSALHESVIRLREAYPTLEVNPFVGDFSEALPVPPSLLEGDRGRRVVFFPGSTISNFSPRAAVPLLRNFRALLRTDDFLLIGVDLVKDREVLLQAYDDAAGVTAQFNLNLLERIREELSPEFDVGQFSHRAVFNESESRIEMHLVSSSNHVQEVCGKLIAFRQGETIHTEDSYKFTVRGFLDLARRAGFSREAQFKDSKEYFSIHLLRATAGCFELPREIAGDLPD